MEQPYPVQLKQFVRFSTLMFVAALFTIIVTMIVSTFMYEKLATMCICTSNKLVWGWVFMAISILTGLVSTSAAIFCGCKKPLEQRRFILPYTAILLQTAAFITGLIFIILFGAYVLNVLG